ncbi:hypothetical protein BDW02DRAFT_587016 [Decorospora gaudefroyi]|uniref:DUF7137 domain-containing protein n=1 Tax=Decorospora gaudefroyi TaxID=184978 RepID=A0A6A5KLG9_9PLEO|nr:hypothetical protein BDW02DRAFT_587016 [Decorospora gaudefroyi]
MRPSQILAAVVAMSSVTHAMSDAFDNIHGLADVKDVLLGRQNDDSDNASSDAPTKTQASKPSEEKPTPTETGDSNKEDDDEESSSTKKEASGTGKPTGSKTSNGKSKSTSFDARLPAGGLTMVTPNALAGTQFYKVGDWVTFAWNYTSVLEMPTAVDVLASCTANQATYTISVNMSATQTEVLWNTGETPSGQVPFLTENYKLLIYDSKSSVSATPRAGYFAPFSMFTFGMYLPQEYVSMADGYTCANCNSALSHFEKMTLSTLLFTTGTTLGSLLYFTYQFGLW